MHYLRNNHAERTPGTVVFLDTETRVIPNTEPEVQALRLWCSRLVDRVPNKRGRSIDVCGFGDTSRELVAWLGEVMQGHRTAWVFTHNLGFDMVATQLPPALVAAGWEVTDASIGGRAPWLKFRRGNHRLVFVDSCSWLPYKLADVADRLGMVKPELPDSDDSRAAWLGRCGWDTEILATAMLQILDWWDTQGLGNFATTGAACGWNAFRHLPRAQQVTINTEPGLIEADRAAIHGGRRNVWRVGSVHDAELVELDFRAAYPSIAAELPLPVARGAVFDSLPLDDATVSSDRWQISARVLIETEVPRWPIKWARAEWYPVGTFWTTLAGPEINEAARLGCLRVIGPGQVHRLGYAMSEWAHWCLRVQDGRDEYAPPAAELVAKAWGRTVIGKWAARGFDKIELGPAPTPGWAFEPGWDHHGRCDGGMVDIGGRRWWVSASGSSDNAYPAVFAWVESHTRIRLNRVIEALGPGSTIQCDTDGLIIRADRLVRWALDTMPELASVDDAELVMQAAAARLSTLTAPLVLRVKRRLDGGRFLGPQHYEAGGQRRFAGLPKDAERVGQDKYAGKIWPGLKWQLQHGDTRGYVRPSIEATIAGPYASGWVLRSGRVLPVRTVAVGNGETEVLPWALMPESRSRTRLSDAQHPALQSLLSAKAGVMPPRATG